MEKKTVIVIVGPTASGKTSISIELAKKINSEIVSADSMQIYREMDIGTAKPTEEEKSGIKHYMIDIVNPDEIFNVSKYKMMAEKAINDIIEKGKTPIVVGGTGLYISTLINGIEFTNIEGDVEYRDMLKQYAKEQGIEKLHSKLEKIDPEAAKVINKENVRRVIRALEIYKITKKTKTQLDKESIKEVKYDYKIFGLMWDREKLYQRINKRVDIMINDGLIEEVRNLIQKYTLSSTAIQGLGYKEVIEYINGQVTYEQMIEKLKMETRRYAKRQMTWFKRDKRINWISAENSLDSICSLIEGTL